jgi:hypothetical protein
VIKELSYGLAFSLFHIGRGSWLTRRLFAVFGGATFAQLILDP